MEDIKDLIREYPELGEVLAEFENRISFLENSQLLYTKYEQPSTKSVQPTNKEVMDKLHKIGVLVNDLEARLNKHIDSSKQDIL